MRGGRHVLIAAGLSIAFGIPGAVADDSASKTITITQTDKLEWKDYPGLPGVKVAVLAGDPSQAGLYVIRAKFAPHTMSTPHWHPEARYVTVLKGTWWAGTGDVLDPNKTTPVPTGGFAVHTPKMAHYDGAKDEEVIVQISGMGPSGTIPVEPGGAKN
ncbi:MAG: cupin domain-containing protein [Rhizobacter sp.]|nr:cupin domain-containing protein [Rhizobacter sp.]